MKKHRHTSMSVVLNITYLQVLQIYVSNSDVSVKVNTLLNSGSESTLVTRTLAGKVKALRQIRDILEGSSSLELS